MLRWPVRDALLAYEEQLRDDALAAYRERLRIWAVLNAGASKRSKPPSLPPILRS